MRAHGNHHGGLGRCRCSILNSGSPGLDQFGDCAALRMRSRDRSRLLRPTTPYFGALGCRINGKAFQESAELPPAMEGTFCSMKSIAVPSSTVRNMIGIS